MSTYLKRLTHTTVYPYNFLFNDCSSMIKIYIITIKNILATKHPQWKQYLIHNNHKTKICNRYNKIKPTLKLIKVKLNYNRIMSRLSSRTFTIMFYTHLYLETVRQNKYWVRHKVTTIHYLNSCLQFKELMEAISCCCKFATQNLKMATKYFI